MTRRSWSSIKRRSTSNATSATRSSPPPAACPSTSSRSTRNPSLRCPMQNLAERVHILKYMECKGFRLMSWLLIMERKNAIDSFDHSKGRYDIWKILRRVLDHGG